MQLTCAHYDDCDTAPTVAIITGSQHHYDVVPACSDHAPEVMHELICSGVTTDDMVKVTIDKPIAPDRTLPSAPHTVVGFL